MLLNRGRRHFDLSTGRLSPGEMIEVSAEEAKQLSSYTDLVDASKIPVRGAAAAEATRLKAANSELASENAKLKEQLAAASDDNKKKPKE